MAKSPVNEIMDAQAEDARTDSKQRNGYRKRSPMTSVGAIRPRIPKPRHSNYFPEDPIAAFDKTAIRSEL